MRNKLSPVYILTGLAKIALVSALVVSGSNARAIIGLGAASPYALFQLGGGQNFNVSDAYVNGNVALGPGNYNTSIGGSFGINGDVYDSGNRAILQPANLLGWDITDPLGSNPSTFPFENQIFHNVNLSQAVLDAQNASTAASALPADFNLGNVTGPATVVLNSVPQMTPGVYVIDTTKLALNSGQVLTLDGTGIAPGSQVIINETGQFALNGGSILFTGGLDANHILVNDTSTQAASITGGGILQGSFLGPNLNAQFNNNAAAVYGQVIVQSVQFSSHFRVFGELFVPEPSTVMAGMLLLLPLGAGVFRAWRKIA